MEPVEKVKAAIGDLQASPLVVRLKEQYEQAFQDPDFLSDTKRVEKAIKGFEQPDLSERVIKQIRTQVEKDLYKEFALGKRKAVSPDDIKNEVQNRYQKHLERKQGSKDDTGFVASIKQAAKQ